MAGSLIKIDEEIVTSANVGESIVLTYWSIAVAYTFDVPEPPGGPGGPATVEFEPALPWIPWNEDS